MTSVDDRRAQDCTLPTPMCAQDFSRILKEREAMFNQKRAAE
ncbi:unnamed protein product, partial [Soboliphyme baturini]|uniref:Uncharacterized protein n=1 Tax=Soboliphyme baturini TaxID=241478 RepID=A0A183I8U5_9BILA